jgi:hypothetical protein
LLRFSPCGEIAGKQDDDGALNPKLTMPNAPIDGRKKYILAAVANKAANKPGPQLPKRVLSMIAAMRSTKGLLVSRGVINVNMSARALKTSAVPKVKSSEHLTGIILSLLRQRENCRMLNPFYYTTDEHPCAPIGSKALSLKYDNAFDGFTIKKSLSK